MSEAETRKDDCCTMDWSRVEAECRSGGCPGHILPNGQVVSHDCFVEFCKEYEALKQCPEGRRHCVSESGEIPDDDCSLNSCSESESGSSAGTSEGSQDDGWDEIDTGPSHSDARPAFFGSEADRTSGVPQARVFEYSKNHTCGSDSVFESDNSDWDMSRDHSLEAEMVHAHDLPDVPRTAGEILEVPQRPFRPLEQPVGLPEIDEDEFARAVRTNRKGFEQDRRHWDLKTRPEARRRVHIDYVKERERKRNAKNAKKMARSPSHEARRLGKLKITVRREAERLKRSMEEKRMQVGEAEHSDRNMKDTVVNEMDGLYGV